MSEILKDYFYTGISFSSFIVDEGVLLCMKYHASKFPLSKIIYKGKLVKYLKNNKESDPCLKGNENYLVYQNIKALNESSVLFSKNKRVIKLYRKLKNDKEAVVVDEFSLDDLTLENFDSPITLVLNSEKSKNKYEELISKAKKIKYVYLDKIKEETNRTIIFDAIKVKLLQDETEIYFIEEGMYAIYIANCVFSLNKFAIIY